jgi:hypothetical protein
MRFEAKKKALTSAISDVRSITETLETAEGSTTALRIKTDGKVLKVSSLYAEATVTEVLVEDAGDVVVDVGSLLQALSVSGNEFKFATKGKHATYSCGRVNGAVELKEVELDDGILQNAPKPTIHVLNLKELLSSLALKAQGQATDRTLHVDAKGKKIRGESTDSFRGVVVTVNVDKDSKIASSAALSLPEKTANVLAKLATDSLVGFNESFFTVKLPGLVAVIPLSSVEPLQLQNQMLDILGSQQTYGEVVFKVSELKDALSDAISAVGKANSPALALVLNKGSTDCTFKGEAQSGEAKVAFKAEDVSITTKGISLGISALYFQECLNFYATDQVKCQVYQGAVVLDLVTPTDFLLGQTTLIPLLSLIEDKAGKVDSKAAEADENETPAPKKPKAKPAIKAEPTEDEEEAASSPPKAEKKAEKPAPSPAKEVDTEAESEDEEFDDEE